MKASEMTRRAALKAACGVVFAASQKLAGAEETRRGIVMGEPKAAEVGNKVLKEGGNAIDAIVAGALVGAVHAPNQYGIGGYGGHLVVRMANGNIRCIDFNGTAPAGAQVATLGWPASGVPGILAGLQMALDRFGTRPFKSLVQPAIALAEEGFPIPQGLSNAIRSREKDLKKDPASAQIYFPKDNALRNPDLARMLRRLASENSVRAFYEGEIARQVAAAFSKNGGLVTEKELAQYKAVEAPPIQTQWKDFTIYTAPLPAGGITVLRIFDVLKELPPDLIDEHALLETMRVAWHERVTKLGDKVSLDALPPAEQLARRVKAAVESGARVSQSTISQPHRGTIHLNAADAAGNVVALTLTHGNTFGACVTVEGLGLTLGHGMSRFVDEPRHPNAPAPGKRPLTNMCPTLILRDGKPLLALGAAGGRLIVNTVFHVAWNFVGGKNLQEAVRAPRWHTEGNIDLALEKTWPEPVRARFQKLGYEVRTGGAAVARAIAPREAGIWEAATR
ncbi:MAG TPA: gamma-glutamyltransferase [Verrucomicrobiae bacterium]|nr:gamma-glutamyltransferase [Verrucomicrobiae bacterium]